MRKQLFAIVESLLIVCAVMPAAGAADFDFFGRSGDAIKVQLSGLPGVGAGATFSALNIGGFANHTVLTSDTLTGQPFASTGALWVFPNPARDTAGEGDANPSARGFQGALSGSLLINGVAKSFSVLVQPGYTGNGTGAVGQSLERIDRAANNPLFVAEQQQRLRYFGFVRSGGSALPVTGTFDAGTDQATRTFQGAFVGGVNTGQDDVDGIIGPNTAGWLNAANAPTWEELVDPDPQPPGTFSVSRLIGNFDILPGRDPGTNARTGNTKRPERFGTSWEIDLIKKGSALAKATTGRTQMINAMTAADGYGSSCCHSTRQVGMYIDLHTDSSTWDNGDGTVDTEEQRVINHAKSFLNAGASGTVARMITSNNDLLNGINALKPGIAIYDDTNVHINHLHIDVAPPARVADAADLAGDFNLDDVVNAADYVVWREGLNKTFTQAGYNTWRANFGKSVGGAFGLAAGVVPEPGAIALLMTGMAGLAFGRGWRRSI